MNVMAVLDRRIWMRFDDRVTGRLDKYAKQAKVIHLDIDPRD